MKNLLIVITLVTLISCSVMKSNNQTISMETKNISSLMGDEKAVQTSLLFNNVDQKVIVLKIQKDQILKEHISKVPALLICISGDGIYTENNGKKVVMKEGDYVEIPKDILHAVSANETSEFLLIK